MQRLRIQRALGTSDREKRRTTSLASSSSIVECVGQRVEWSFASATSKAIGVFVVVFRIQIVSEALLDTHAAGLGRYCVH